MLFTFYFILVLQIVNFPDSRLANNFAANRQFWSIESLRIFHVTAGRVELLWIHRFVEKLRMMWCSHSRKSSYIFVCSASFGRSMSVFFHAVLPCCSARQMRGVEHQRAKSWRGKDDSWGAAPSRIAARHPIEPSPPFLTTRLAVMPSPLESQKTLVNIWFLFYSFYHSSFIFILNISDFLSSLADVSL